MSETMLLPKQLLEWLQCKHFVWCIFLTAPFSNSWHRHWISRIWKRSSIL